MREGFEREVSQQYGGDTITSWCRPKFKGEYFAFDFVEIRKIVGGWM